jgi:hypothetical protein
MRNSSAAREKMEKNKKSDTIAILEARGSLGAGTPWNAVERRGTPWNAAPSPRKAQWQL